MIRNRSSSSFSSSSSVLICSKVVLLLLLITTTDHCNGDEQKAASLAKMATDTVSVLKNSYSSSWDKVKTIIRDMQMQFSPPNLDFKSGNAKSAKDKVTGAAEKSVEVSKSTVEETAQTAGEAVGSTVKMTADKVKSIGDQKSGHEEL